MMEPELPGQGTIKQNREQRVGVHLVAHDELIIELNGTISTDQTGRFPIMSQKGNQYMMVLYNYDSNAILAEGCKSRAATDLEATYDKLYNRLTKAGIVPVMQRIDNEVSKVLIESIEAKGLKYQLASPHDHRLNPAERAVQTWKNHFISNLHGYDRHFPAYKWCEIMHQCEMTLNMLRRSIGDKETYYLHALKYYIPKHARKIWDTHKLGIGIFTMQGFERRNKESKNIMRRFNIKKHNICSQILQRLWDYFSHNNDYKNNKGKRDCRKYR